jgi:hypothetical protein
MGWSYGRKISGKEVAEIWQNRFLPQAANNDQTLRQIL